MKFVQASLVLAIKSKLTLTSLLQLESQDVNGIWTRDPTIPEQRFHQPSYEDPDVGSWS